MPRLLRRWTLLRVFALPVRLLVRRLRRLFATNENALFFTAVCAVGLLGGLAGAAFRWLFDLAVRGFWGGGGTLVEVAGRAPWGARLLVPAAGGLLAGALALLFRLRRREGAGFPEMLEVVSLGGRVIRLTPALERALASLTTLASGGSVGREGPMGQVSAAIGSRIGRSLGLSEERIRVLVAAGIAAGFAAAYNTPIGATLFVMEVIVGSFNMAFFGPAIVAAAIATLVTRTFAGPAPIYAVSGDLEMASAWEVGPFLVLGLAAGLLAVLYQATLGGMYRLWDKARLPLLVRPAVGGLCVGALAVAWPWVLGNGYEGINLVLAGRLALGLVAVLALAKIVATTVTLASGGSGGAFTSILFVGAMLGGVFGGVVHAVAPEWTAPGGAYALAGMAGLVAGTTHAPLLAIILVFELTQNYGIVLPLMLAAVPAYWIARALRPTSIYTEELRRRGMSWEGTAQERLMRSLKVRDIMESDVEPVPANLPLDRIVDTFQNSRQLQLYVVDDARRLIGVVELHEVKRVLGEEDLPPLVIAADLASEIPVVTPDDSLVEVNEKLWMRDLGHLPVVQSDDDPVFLGVVTRRDVLGAFDREVLKRNALLAKVRSMEGTGFDYLEMPSDTRMAKVAVPRRLVGLALAETGLRDAWGITVLAIERIDRGGREQRIAPRAETVLERGDRLVVMGTPQAVERLERE